MLANWKKRVFPLNRRQAVFAMLLCLVLAACAVAEGNWKIAILTGTTSQGEEEFRAAERAQKADPEHIVTDTYPDNFMAETETTISKLIAFASDPDVKAIVMCQAVPGAKAAFDKIRAMGRDDMLLIAGVPQEDPAVITAAADFVLYTDEPKQGDTIMETCAKWGIDVFVHYSFPRHLAYETMSRRVAIMKAACEEFGMKFVLETAPDPTSDVGVSGAQAYILEQVPAWVEKYGQKAAYFCTNDAHTEPLLKRLLECGGYFIEADLPSPLMGYPGALGLDLTEEAGDFEKILNKVESAIVEKGGADHFGTWAYSYGYTLSAGLALHAKNVLDGKSELKDMDDVAAALQVYSPKAAWNGASYTNATTGAKSENVFLIYQDTYIMGNPGHFMGNADVEIPEKYFTIS